MTTMSAATTAAVSVHLPVRIARQSAFGSDRAAVGGALTGSVRGSGTTPTRVHLIG